MRVGSHDVDALIDEVSVNCSCSRTHSVGLKGIEVVNGHAGETVLRLIGENCCAERVAVAVDRVTLGVLGGEVAGALSSSGIEVKLVEVTKADEANVSAVERSLAGTEFAVAVGGGTVIDVCKLASYRSGKPFVSVPTALSHDGISSPVASIWLGDRPYRTSVLAREPMAVVADISVLRGSPRRLAAAGVGDLLAKVTALKDWELGKRYGGEEVCEAAYQLEVMAIKRALEFVRGGLREHEKLLEGLVFSGLAMSLVGSSRPASGSEHLISHYIDGKGKSRALHGEQVALGTVAMALYHSEVNDMWWKEERLGWRRIRRVMEEVGLPVTLAEIGLNEEDGVGAIVNAADIRPERFTVLHMRRPSEQEAMSLLRRTGIC
ncbi:MAG: iron-containing alcohol dehydrogenase [Thaumarchaeota archaeon]|nr:iron-containing alcohol dehydrogenase [Candidatus Calditenuaceae archaeon]MDW8187214.1 iron-containing alcohol dehydrogenase [Nitrososphaerota archaeon]